MAGPLMQLCYMDIFVTLLLSCFLQHLLGASSFRTAARELLEWCLDERAFQPHFEAGLISCLTVSHSQRYCFCCLTVNHSQRRYCYCCLTVSHCLHYCYCYFCL